MMGMASLNIYPIIVSAIVAMVLGALWYSPLLFGNAWMKALGKTKDQLGAAVPAMIGSLVVCVVSAFSMEFIVVAVGANTLAAGAIIGIAVGVGVVAMAMLSDALFSGWGWPLYFIQSGYRVSYLILMGMICCAWPW